MIAIEDEAHAEEHGRFETLEAAMAELRRLATLAWDAEPNRAPCQSWKNCGRRYELVWYDASRSPRVELRRVLALEMSSVGAKWSAGIDEAGA